MKKYTPLWIGLSVLVAGAGVFGLWRMFRGDVIIDRVDHNSNQTNSVPICTDDAKICPDGTAVGRTGPNCEFAACPGESTNKNQNVTTSSNTPAASGQALKLAQTLAIDGSFYSWKSGDMYKVSLHDGKSAKLFTFPTTGTVKSVAYNDQTDGIAYITTSGVTDSLKYRVRGNDTFWTLDTLSREGTDPVQQAARFVSAEFVNNTTVLARAGFWEGCGDRLFNTTTKKKVWDDWCGLLGVSPNQRRFVKTAANGIATGNEFDVAISITGPFTPLDWSSMSGDVRLVYNAIEKRLIAGFNGHTFINDDQLLVTVVRETGSAFLAKVDLKKKTITQLVDLLDGYYGEPILSGRTVVWTGQRKIGIYNLDTKSWKEWTADFAPDEVTANFFIVGATSDALIARAESGYKNETYTKSKIVIINPSQGTYIDLGDDPALIFAGVGTE